MKNTPRTLGVKLQIVIYDILLSKKYLFSYKKISKKKVLYFFSILISVSIFSERKSCLQL
jgi:hypothetical protein